MEAELRDAILAWATKQVSQLPTIAVEDATAETGVVTKPNTIELALIEGLRNHFAEQLASYKANELREYLLDLATEGTKGYEQMTRDELIEAVWDELFDKGTVADIRADYGDDESTTLAELLDSYLGS